jgi:hypothetical protein
MYIDPEWPSWIPDWADDMTKPQEVEDSDEGIEAIHMSMPLNHHLAHAHEFLSEASYSASLDSKPSTTIDKHDNSPTVRGIIVDRIKEVSGCHATIRVGDFDRMMENFETFILRHFGNSRDSNNHSTVDIRAQCLEHMIACETSKGNDTTFSTMQGTVSRVSQINNYGPAPEDDQDEYLCGGSILNAYLSTLLADNQSSGFRLTKNYLSEFWHAGHGVSSCQDRNNMIKITLLIATSLFLPKGILD